MEEAVMGHKCDWLLCKILSSVGKWIKSGFNWLRSTELGKSKHKQGGSKMAVGTFAFVKFGSKMKDKQKKVREAFEKLESAIKLSLKDNTEKTTSLKAVEEAYVWASRSIRSEQVCRNNGNTR